MPKHELSEGRILFAAVVVTTIIFAIWWWLVVNWYGHAQNADEFGSSFGGLSALFAGLGCAGIAISLWYQTRQLKSQQHELDATQRALNEQVKALNRQAASIQGLVESITRPVINVRLELQHDTSRHLVIENLGRSVACNLVLHIDRSFTPKYLDRDLTRLNEADAFTRPLPSFAPGDKLVYFLLHGKYLHSAERDKSKSPDSFAVSIRYSSLGREEYCETVLIDLMMHSSTIVDTDYVRKELHRLNGSIEKAVGLMKDRL